jgi:hypothetical protein
MFKATNQTIRPMSVAGLNKLARIEARVTTPVPMETHFVTTGAVTAISVNVVTAQPEVHRSVNNDSVITKISAHLVLKCIMRSLR